MTDAVKAATAAFCKDVEDPKAQIIVGFSAFVGRYTYITVLAADASLVAFQAGQTLVTINMFYDAPTPPPGLFDALLAPPAIATDISTRSFSSLVASTPVNQMAGFR